MISDIMNIGLTNVAGELIKEDEWCVLNGINPDDDNLVNQIAFNWDEDRAYALHFRRYVNDSYREDVCYFKNSNELTYWKMLLVNEQQYDRIESSIIDLYIMENGVPVTVEDITFYFVDVSSLGDEDGSN